MLTYVLATVLATAAPTALPAAAPTDHVTFEAAHRGSTGPPVPTTRPAPASRVTGRSNPLAQGVTTRATAFRLRVRHRPPCQPAGQPHGPERDPGHGSDYASGTGLHANPLDNPMDQSETRTTRSDFG